MTPLATPLSANSRRGRILLALRPGGMRIEQLEARSGCDLSSSVTALKQAGLIEVDSDAIYTLTAAGRSACPLRRDARPEYNLRLLGMPR